TIPASLESGSYWQPEARPAPAPPPPPVARPEDPAAWLRDVPRLGLHRLALRDSNYPGGWLRMTGNDAEARNLTTGGGWKHLGLLGYASHARLQGMRALWRGALDRFYLEGNEPRTGKEGVLAWVWTEARPGLIKVFVLQDARGAMQMTTD